MMNLLGRLKSKVKQIDITSVVLRNKINHNHKLEKIGTDYGGWVVPINITKNSKYYCAGVGEDISFDIELIKRFNCEVFAFDPTPRAIEFVKQKTANLDKYFFFPIGLWNSEATLKFFAPKNPNHVSHSIKNLQSTERYFEGKCKRLSNIMEELGHSSIFLLKIDIEGAEYEIIESIIEDNLDVKIFCVEFDQPMPLKITLNTINKLINWKYDLVFIDRWNYTFIKKNMIFLP